MSFQIPPTCQVPHTYDHRTLGAAEANRRAKAHAAFCNRALKMVVKVRRPLVKSDTV